MTQQEQDVITLAFTKWSAERRSRRLPQDHDLWKRERDAVLSRQRSSNAVARHDYLNNLEGLKTAKSDENESKLDEELAPRKAMLKHQWLAAHTESTPEDFERKAWKHLRANLVEELNAERLAAEQKATKGRLSGLLSI